MKYTTVIFDLDDTLCNTTEILDEVLESFYNDNISHFPGKPVAELKRFHDQAYQEIVMNSDVPINSAYILFWYRFFELLHMKPSTRAIHEFTEEVSKEMAKRIKLTAGSIKLLEELKRQSVTIGILTNGTFYQQTNKIISLNIDHLIDYLVTPDTCLADKPDPKAFHYILEKLEAKPEKSLMVGDNFAADIVGAKQSGLDAAYIDMGRNDRTGETEPDYSISTISELHTQLFT